MANKQPQWVIDALMGHSYKGSYAEGIMEQGLTNADVRKVVASTEVDFYNRAGYSGDAITQFSGSNVEGKPKIRIQAGSKPKDPPDIPPQDPPPTSGGTTTTTKKVQPKIDWAKKWGGRFLKYVVPSLISPQALTAEITLDASEIGATDKVSNQVQMLMSTGLSEQEAINKYKENRASGKYPEEATYYGTIEDYEKDFLQEQKRLDDIKQQESNFAEILEKGYMKADIKYPNE